MRTVKVAALALLLIFSLCGCFLLPQEAKIPDLPLVTPYAGEEFQTVNVKRGDMTLSETINCTYSATKSENLSFSTAGEPFGSVFVEVGDYVKAGTLVAQLDVSSVLDDIDSVNSDIKKLEIQLVEENKALDLALLTEDLNGGNSTVSSDAKKASIAYKESSLDVLNMKKSELEAKLKARRLYASISGTVTYVKKITDGLKSTKDENIVIITDMDSSVFMGDTANSDRFKPGQEVTIKTDEGDFSTVYTPAEQLGLKGQDDGLGRKTAYFKITGAETPKQSGAKGYIELYLDSRKDVLMLPTSAVFSVDGQYMVYYQDEKGVKSTKEVECGLESGSYVEITDGLNEGDCVIIG